MKIKQAVFKKRFNYLIKISARGTGFGDNVLSFRCYAENGHHIKAFSIHEDGDSEEWDACHLPIRGLPVVHCDPGISWSIMIEKMGRMYMLTDKHPRRLDLI